MALHLARWEGKIEDGKTWCDLVRVGLIRTDIVCVVDVSIRPVGAAQTTSSAFGQISVPTSVHDLFLFGGGKRRTRARVCPTEDGGILITDVELGFVAYPIKKSR